MLTCQVKTVKTTAPKPSFFHYFGEPLTEEEFAEEEENEDEDAPRIKLSEEEDFHMGEFFVMLAWSCCVSAHSSLWLI